MVHTLHFADDRSSGLVHGVGPDGGDAEARGDVEVPDDKLVALVAVLGTDDGPADLSGLAGLAPDDLAGLAAIGLVAGQLAAAAHLTGLQQVVAYGTVVDGDIAWFDRCPKLAVVDLDAAAITPTTLHALLDLPALSALRLRAPKLDAATWAVLAQRSFPYLALEDIEVTADVLDNGPAVQSSELSLSGDALDGEAVARLVARSPAVTTITARRGEASALPPSAGLALRRARPGLALDGAVLGRKAIDRLARSIGNSAQPTADQTTA